jgi:hypothetical protein
MSIIWIAAIGSYSYVCRASQSDPLLNKTTQPTGRVKFTIKSSNGHTYEIDGPPGATENDARAAVLEQRLHQADFSEKEIDELVYQSKPKWKFAPYYIWLYAARDSIGSLFCIFAIISVLNWIWNGRKIGKSESLISGGKQA